MLGAIVGDVVGSRFEFANHKSKDFELFVPECRLTDDSVMTLAVAKALIEADDRMDRLDELVISNMQLMGRRYPDAGYGGRFARWLEDEDPQPYHSYGNGAGMRISPVAYVGSSIEEIVELSEIVTAVTHDHPEGIKGGEAIAVATYLARTHHDKEYIRDYVSSCYYDLDFSLDSIRDEYRFYVDAMRSTPVAIEAFLEGTDFEDVIRGAISVGGDSDTIGAMAGAIAGAYYGVPDDIARECYAFFDDYERDILEKFESKYME